MKLSLVICTRNRAPQLAEALQSLLKLHSSFPWELIVVDNGSTDNTQEIIAQFKTQLPMPCISVIEPRGGLGIARNRGWTTAGGEIIAFTDDDCYPDPEYLTSIVQCFEEDSQLGFVGCRVLLYDPTDYPLAIQELNRRVDIKPKSFIGAGFIHGAGFACRRSALEDVGGFDEWFGAGALFSCEDVDILARISARGWNGAYDPRPVVYHHHRRKGFGDVAHLSKQYGRARGAYYAKCLLSPVLRFTYAKTWFVLSSRQSPLKTANELLGAGEYLVRVLAYRRLSRKRSIPQDKAIPADVQ